MSLCRDDLSETLIELAEIPGGRGEYAFTYSPDSQEPGAEKRIEVLAPNGAGEWQARPVAYLTVLDIHGTPYFARNPRRRTLERVVREFLDGGAVSPRDLSEQHAETYHRLVTS